MRGYIRLHEVVFSREVGWDRRIAASEIPSVVRETNKQWLRLSVVGKEIENTLNRFCKYRTQILLLLNSLVFVVSSKNLV